MSTPPGSMPPGGPGGPEGRPPTEEELRAAYEAEIKRIRVEDVVVQTVVSLLNLGGRKAGLVPGSEDERDLDQLRQAVEGVRALLPLAEPGLGDEAKQLRDALAQLQRAYAQGGGGPAPAREEAPSEPPKPEPPPSSGRLWVPGQ